jgi:hypothetical protein
MTTPSRRHEILKRRARKHKIAILRRRYAQAASEADHTRILGKLQRLSPQMTVEEFTRGVKAAT